MGSGQAWVAGRREAARDREFAASLRPLASERTVLGVLLVVVAADALWLGLTSRAGDWQPVWVLLVLLVFAIVSELGSSQYDGVFVSISFLALILAAALLGPVPAAIVAVVAVATDTIIYRKPVSAILKNGAILLTLVAAAATAVLIVVGSRPEVGEEAQLSVTVFAVTAAGAAFNVAMVAALHRVEYGMPLAASFRSMLVPALPFVLVSATLTGAAAYLFVAEPPAMFLGVVVILLGTELLVRAAAASRLREKEMLALTQQRSELLEQALEAREAERAWLASHLHDQTLQQIAIAQQELAEDDSERAAAALAGAVEELRRTLTHFHPASVHEIGLETALTAYAGQLARRRQTKFSIHVDAATDPDEAAALYSVGRELLANAAKHAHASRVSLSIGPTKAGVRLEVSDDGRGFDPAVPVPAGHVGLATVRRQVAVRGGRLEITSSPGGGTTVTAVLPREPLTRS